MAIMGYGYDRKFTSVTLDYLGALELPGTVRRAWEVIKSCQVPTGGESQIWVRYGIVAYKTDKDVFLELRGWTMDKGSRRFFNIGEKVMSEIFNYGIGAECGEVIDGHYLFYGKYGKFTNNYHFISQDILHKFPLGKLLVQHGVALYLLATHPLIQTLENAIMAEAALKSIDSRVPSDLSYNKSKRDLERITLASLQERLAKENAKFETICNDAADAINTLSQTYGIEVVLD